MGTLFIVATPIGNLRDMTERAQAVLAEVGLVGLADRVGAKPADPGVLFFELLAARMKRVGGDCDALA